MDLPLSKTLDHVNVGEEGVDPPVARGNAQKRYRHFVRHQIIPIVKIEVNDPDETKALVLVLSRTLAVESSQSDTHHHGSTDPVARRISR